ncbi:DUF1447 family protein [Terrilactibacillus sp. BCM23-1]|uniref:DNA-directed RNA polymerase subunit epsilon n=1 Tax=Terrilactibacillus tamarindi TaxID=2599694 RepID=A0A6N8CSR2_9BACI|nr:DNA-directed RNA polymerase subunit epsilon [Terrilactibacillus tamarindi]MTT31975.1 DUF1447 family protein [Terrilactibacillus tamarindi]
MIFKVLYQASKTEVPIRENTKTMYIEGENESDVREKLAERPYNIEFVQPISGAFLEYEKNSDTYQLEKI